MTYTILNRYKEPNSSDFRVIGSSVVLKESGNVFRYSINGRYSDDRIQIIHVTVLLLSKKGIVPCKMFSFHSQRASAVAEFIRNNQDEIISNTYIYGRK